MSVITRYKTSILLLLLAGVAAFLRFNGLTFQSYWSDELFSALVSDPERSLDEVVARSFGDVHPPLYQIVLWVWYRLFGYTEFVGRSLSAIAGVLVIPAIYYLGRLIFDKRVGLYAAILAACNYYLIYFSQETRSYSFLVLLTLISFICLIRLLQNPARGSLVAYIVSILAVVYTHYYGFFIFASHVACMMVVLVSREVVPKLLLRYSLIAVAAAGMLLLPLVPVVLRSDGSGGVAWIDQPQPWYLIEYLEKFLLSGYLAAVFAVFLVLGIIRLWRLRGEPRSMAIGVLGFWAVFIFIVPYLKGLISAPILTSRYAIVGLPVLMILAAAGITFIKRDYAGHLVLVLISLMALYSLHDTAYYTKLEKEQYRDLARDLIDVNISNIPIYNARHRAERFNVYFKQFGSPMRVERYEELERLLSANKTARCFWLADVERKIDRKNVVENYHLHKVGMIRRFKTVAFLLATEGSDLSACPMVNDTGVFLATPADG